MADTLKAAIQISVALAGLFLLAGEAMPQAKAQTSPLPCNSLCRDWLGADAPPEPAETVDSSPLTTNASENSRKHVAAPIRTKAVHAARRKDGVKPSLSNLEAEDKPATIRKRPSVAFAFRLKAASKREAKAATVPSATTGESHVKNSAGGTSGTTTRAPFLKAQTAAALPASATRPKFGEIPPDLHSTAPSETERSASSPNDGPSPSVVATTPPQSTQQVDTTSLISEVPSTGALSPDGSGTAPVVVAQPELGAKLEGQRDQAGVAAVPAAKSPGDEPGEGPADKASGLTQVPVPVEGQSSGLSIASAVGQAPSVKVPAAAQENDTRQNGDVASTSLGVATDAGPPGAVASLAAAPTTPTFVDVKVGQITTDSEKTHVQVVVISTYSQKLLNVVVRCDARDAQGRQVGQDTTTMDLPPLDIAFGQTDFPLGITRDNSTFVCVAATSPK